MISFLPLVQLIDSAFPTGAFSHSFGLETFLQEGRVQNAGELKEWLESYITGSLAPMEGAVVFWAYRYAEKVISTHPESELARENLKLLDRRITLSKPARESREGEIKIGKRFLHIVQELYPESGLEQYASWIRSEECYGSNAIVHGWICAYLKQTPQAAVLTHLYAGVNSLVQNALRAMAIGQTEGQKVLNGLLQLIGREAERLALNPPAPENLYSNTLAQEIGAMRHEILYSRLFMS
ncbi:urease accessory protein UreF [Effusibacillus lacus]|uniref:Urease accessory protein UreF n=1 Tax=Effusibacillus lacus TaxID=1348429 RepID=A0A292YD72_9BACL|nr:urease accessory UreF family protein [Effusibacillus lacus]TCS71236.1 urease accessory protein [Effusibacillus lacus]GAX89862.1 urease accessory protein UreF [Effusibacillus lacus]